jgi:hypothetical protein
VIKQEIIVSNSNKPIPSLKRALEFKKASVEKARAKYRGEAREVVGAYVQAVSAEEKEAASLLDVVSQERAEQENLIAETVHQAEAARLAAIDRVEELRIALIQAQKDEARAFKAEAVAEKKAAISMKELGKIFNEKSAVINAESYDRLRKAQAIRDDRIFKARENVLDTKDAAIEVVFAELKATFAYNAVKVAEFGLRKVNGVRMVFKTVREAYKKGHDAPTGIDRPVSKVPGAGQ